MRKIQRLDLPARTEKALSRKQAEVDTKLAAHALDVGAAWKSARQSKPIKTALGVLQKMAGNRQRCMYCGDSHGADIEHFWPKQPYPKRMFIWSNLLLCCTECGRFKGKDFPMQNGSPLLVDPTSDDPWEFLDFDPATGNIVARFEPAANDWTAKGSHTVKVLHLDCREALAASYQRTHRRLKSLVNAALLHPPPDPRSLLESLREIDDHGLAGWCFHGTGQNEAPFSTLRTNHPEIWTHCAQAVF